MFCVAQKVFCVPSTLVLVSKTLVLETQKMVANLETIFWLLRKMIAVLRKIFSFEKNMVSGIEKMACATHIIFSTTETMARVATVSWLSNGPSDPIASLYYFESLIEQIREHPFPPGYRDYMRMEVKKLSKQWELSRQKDDPLPATGASETGALNASVVHKSTGKEMMLALFQIICFEKPL